MFYLNKLLALSFIMAAIPVTGAFSQEAPVAGGGDATGSGGSVAFSIGQVVYTYNSGGGGTENLGVQQPYEIYTGVGPESNAGIALQIFPNPVTDQLVLLSNQAETPDLSYRLFDVKGALITGSRVFENETVINLNSLPAATYFLSIISENKEIKSFKIIKN